MVTRARTDLEEAELAFRSQLLDNVSDAIFVYPPSGPEAGRLIYVNQAAVEGRGYSREELLGKNILDILSEPLRDNFREWMRALEERGEITVESAHVRKDGSVVLIEAHIRKMSYRGRTVAVNAARDVSERKLAEGELQRSKELSDSLNEIDSVVHSTLEMNQILESVVDAAAEALGSDSALELRERETWPVRFAHGRPERMLGGPLTPEEPIISGTVARTREPLVLSDAASDHIVGKVAAAHGIRSLLAVPLLLRGDVFGVLVFPQYDRLRQWEDAEVDFATRLGNSVSLALENSRLFDLERREARISQTLAGISTRLAAARDPAAVLPEVLRLSAEVLDAVGAIIATKEAGGWRTRYAYGAQMDRIGQFHTDEESTVRSRMARTREAFIMPDAFENESTAYFARRGGYRSYISLPLVFRGDVVGALSFLFDEPRQAFPEAERLFMDRVAFIISTAEEGARLFTEAEESRATAQQELTTTRTLLRAAESISRWTDLDEMFGNLAEVVLESVDHSRSWIFTWDETTLSAKLVSSAGKDAMRPGTMLEFEGLSRDTQDVLAQKRSRVVDYDALPPEQRGPADRLGSHLLLLVPAMQRGRLVGLIGIDDPGERREFSDREIALVEGIATQAASAMENARLYEAQRDVAETLQATLLSIPDALPGYEFAHIYFSATETARVGGDFYDLFELEDGRLGVTIGDISGKGLSAAAMTSLVKDSVRSQAFEHPDDPAAVVDLANRLLFRSSAPEIFATLFFAVFDRDHTTMIYCNAGHTTPFVVGSHGVVTGLPPTSPLVGAFGEMTYTGASAEMPKGDSLLLYTDGLIEARGRDASLYGEERVRRLLDEAGGEGPENLVSDVSRAVVDFAGGRLGDDLALLAVRAV